MGRKARTLRYRYDEGRFTCGSCKKKLNKKDSCYAHTYYTHKEYISIDSIRAGQYITLHGRPYTNTACKLCGKNGFSKADHVVRHLGSQAHRGKEMEYRIEFTNMPKPKIRRGIKSGEKVSAQNVTSIVKYLPMYYTSIDEVGHDADEIVPPGYPNYVSIRDQFEVPRASKVCDFGLHYIECEYVLIELKGSDFDYAVKQITTTITRAKENGYNVIFGIIVTKKLNSSRSNIYKRNDKTWLVEKRGQKESLKFEGVDIFAVRDGETVMQLFKKLETRGVFPR